MQGRPKKPTALKVLEGTYRKDRAAKNEITPSILLESEPPKNLNEWGVELWARLTREYVPLGVLTAVDVEALTALCTEWGTYQEAADIISAKGLEVEEDVYSSKGELVGSKLVTNPMIKVKNDAFRNFNAMCSKFGLTPSDRGKINTPDKPVGDRFSKFD